MRASRSAAIVLAAETLARHRFERTLRFILFPGETTDCTAHANEMAANSESLDFRGVDAQIPV